MTVYIGSTDGLTYDWDGSTLIVSGKGQMKDVYYG